MPSVVLVMEFKVKSLDCGVYSASSAKELARISAPYDGDVASSVASVVAQVRGAKGFVISDAVVSVPTERVSQRVVELPFDDKKKLDEIAVFEAGESFFSDPDSIVLQAMPLIDGRALIAALDKEYLRAFLSEINGCGLDPTWVGLSLFSRHMLLPAGITQDVTIAVVDANTVTVVKNYRPRFFKEIKGEEDLGLMMLAASNEGFVPEEAYAEKGASAVAERLAPGFQYLEGIDDGCSGIEAMARHYFKGIDGAINFRAGEFAHTAGAKRGRRELIVAALLGAVVFALWGANAHLRQKSYDESSVRIRSGIEAAYRDLFKGESKVVDPVYQMEVKIKEQRDERKMLSGGISALEMMRMISEVDLKGAKVRLHQVSFHAGVVSAKGETSAINAANDFKAALARLPYFKEIVITDVKTSASGGAVFNIDMTLKERT